MGQFLNTFQKGIEEKDKATFHREQYQSFMTAPEWRNVEMAQEYAAFVQEGRSIFQYPYFRQIFDLWRIIFKAYSLARTYNSAWQIITSEYMLMSLFVGVFTTLEFLPKALISLVLAPFVNKENKTLMQRHLADFYQQYAKDLQTIPFYDHQYKEIRETLAAQYRQAKDKTWGDWLSWKLISVELWSRHWISKPLKYWFHQDGGETPATTDILVKCSIADEDASDAEAAKAVFNSRINSLKDKSLALDVVADDIQVKEQSPGKSYFSVFARLRVPRYAAFQEVLTELHAKGIQLRTIAGQERVQLKCAIDADSNEGLDRAQSKLNTRIRKAPSYAYSDSIHPNRRICLFDVHVRDLAQHVTESNTVPNAKVTLIHNF